MLSNDDEDNDDNIICTGWAHLYAKHFIFNISSNPYNASMTERQVQLHFIEKENEAACDLMHILQLVGGRARRVAWSLPPPTPLPQALMGAQLTAYLRAVPAEPAFSLTLLGALAGPFPPRPASLGSASGAGSGGCGWIPSSSVLLWPVGTSGRQEA